MKAFHPPVIAETYEVVFVPCLDSPPLLRSAHSTARSPFLLPSAPEKGPKKRFFVVEVHVRGDSTGGKLYLTRLNPFCFISEYRRRNDGTFIAYERRDDSLFGVTEEMALERLGDRAVTVLPTRFIDCSDYFLRGWILEAIYSFCARRRSGSTKASIFSVVGPAG